MIAPPFHTHTTVISFTAVSHILLTQSIQTTCGLLLLGLAGFIFSAKLHVDDSFHLLTSLEIKIKFCHDFYFYLSHVSATFAACVFCTQLFFAATHSWARCICGDSAVSRRPRLKGKVCLPVDDDRVGWGLVPVATTLLVAASTAGR